MTEARGRYLTRFPIPEEFRAVFPKYAGRKQLITDELVGKAHPSGRPTSSDLLKHKQNIEEIEAVIERCKSQATSKAVVPSSEGAFLYSPDQIIDAIDLWQRKRIDTNRKFGQERELKELHGIEVPLEEFNGRDLISHRLDAVCAMSSRVIQEQSGRFKGRYFVGFDVSCFLERGEFDAYSAIPDFQEQFAQALNGEGLSLRPNAPILGRAFAISAFAAAWARVVRSELYWLCGSELHGADECNHASDIQTSSDQHVKSQIAVIGNTRYETQRLSQLFESYLKSENRKNADRKQTHWQLLIDNFGDIDPADCEPKHFDKLKTEMRDAPLVKSGVYKGIKLSELIARKDEIKERFGNCDPREPKTVFDYFCSYKAVFEYARILRIVKFNPLEGVMPPKPKSARKIKAYSDDDIALIFSKPLFTGCDKVRTAFGRLWGYRNISGSVIERDGRYYMPILALFTGARMEELGGARTEDIKQRSGIWYLDLTNRSLKTENSKRIVPLHPQLVDPNGINFISYLKERQYQRDEYLFPEFRPLPSEEHGLGVEIIALSDDDLDDDDKIQDQDIEVIKMTAKYSKWFGNWCRENRVKQKGKNFHSFRHTMKARLRLPDTNERINDLITGHATLSTGAGYGDDPETILAQLPILYDAICRVVYPTFPKLPDR
jgi:integrase